MKESKEHATDSYSEYMLQLFEKTSRTRSKAIGQFFTPGIIYKPMVECAYKLLAVNDRKTIRIIDPFCGDGRLLTYFLELAEQETHNWEKISVYAWDIDSSALSVAEKNISMAAARAPYDVSVQAECCDAFLVDSNRLELFDACVTNPPWSSTKSLKEKSFNDKTSYEKYQKLAGEYTKELCNRYPEVRGSRSFGTGAINLSRFGLALSKSLVRDGGVCSIVMPSSFTADTSSRKLRESLGTEYDLVNLDYYSAELKLFEGADQAGVAITLYKQKTNRQGSVTSHLLNGQKSLQADEKFWRYSDANGHAIPLGYSQEEIEIIEKMTAFPVLGDNASIHLGREVDETRVADKLCRHSSFRFVKGFMILPYKLLNDEQWFYNDEIAKIPASSYDEKVVWRDISRASQNKRIKATLLPAGYVAGNSLGVATANDKYYLRAFLGILNSRTFEFVARTVLTTNHVSAGALKRMPFPKLCNKKVSDLAERVDAILRNPDDYGLYEDIDRLVAQCYGLNDEEIDVINRNVNYRNLNEY